MTASKRTWWDSVEVFPGGSSARRRRIPFGPVQWDGTCAFVEVTQYRGSGTCRGGDPYNPWRDGKPRAYVNVSAADAQECRDAAAALLAAAELIEGAVGRKL